MIHSCSKNLRVVLPNKKAPIFRGMLCLEKWTPLPIACVRPPLDAR